MIPLIVGGVVAAGLALVFLGDKLKASGTAVKEKISETIDPHKAQVGDVVTVALKVTDVVNKEEVGAKVTPAQLPLLDEIDGIAESGGTKEFTVTKIGQTDRTASQNFMLQFKPNPTVLDIEGTLNDTRLPTVRVRFLSASIRSLTRNGKKIF